jgi:hypothetical protein
MSSTAGGKASWSQAQRREQRGAVMGTSLQRRLQCKSNQIRPNQSTKNHYRLLSVIHALRSRGIGSARECRRPCRRARSARRRRDSRAVEGSQSKTGCPTRYRLIQRRKSILRAFGTRACIHELIYWRARLYTFPRDCVAIPCAFSLRGSPCFPGVLSLMAACSAVRRVRRNGPPNFTADPRPVLRRP